MLTALVNKKVQMPIVLVLSLLLLVVPLSQAVAQDTEVQQDAPAADIIKQAEADATLDESGFGYGVAGFLCGVFGWLAAYLSSPDVPAARIIGKSSNYVVIYSQAYKEKVKNKRTHAALIGCLIGTTVSLIIQLSLANKTSN